MSESTGHRYLESHQISGDILVLDIESESKLVLESARAAAAGHAARTLMKEGPFSIVILGFSPGSALREHRTEGVTSLQALSGSVDLSSPARSERLAPGRIVVFGPGVSHSLTASSEAVILLSIATTPAEA